MNLTLSLSAEGRIIPRQLSDVDARLVLIAVASAQPSLQGLVPPAYQAQAVSLVEEAAALRDDLEAFLKDAQEAAPAVTPPPSAALLDLSDEATLGSVAGLNGLIDNCVGSLAQILEGHARRRAADPRTADAKALIDHLFSGGRGFLLEVSQYQWLAVHERFSDLPQDAWDALDRLGLRADVEAIIALNDRFGVLLGLIDLQLSVPAPALPTLKGLRARFSAFVARYLGLANACWPSPADDATRAAFLKPYLSAELKRAQAVSDARKRTPTLAQPSTPAP